MKKLLRTILSHWAAVLVVLSVLLLMGASDGNGSKYDPGGQRFDRIGHNMMCMCGCGQVLMECNHVGCSTSERMRKELKAAIDRGESDQQIQAGFVAQYGPVVLAAPTHTGFDRVAWIMPVVVFFAGISAVALVVRAWKRRTSALADTGTTNTGEMDDFRRRAREETDL